MSLFGKDSKPDNNGNLKHESAKVDSSFEHACQCFLRACRSEELAHYGLSFHKSDPPTLKAVVLSHTMPGPRVTLINDTVTFDWQPAAFIFLQYPATRELIRQLIERKRVFGVNIAELINNYEAQEKKARRS